MITELVEKFFNAEIARLKEDGTYSDDIEYLEKLKADLLAYIEDESTS